LKITDVWKKLEDETEIVQKIYKIACVFAVPKNDYFFAAVVVMRR
jgi:hypothetical protein